MCFYLILITHLYYGAEEEESIPLYLISLVEHKSQVDYNVSMQLLRYFSPVSTYEIKKLLESIGEKPESQTFFFPAILPCASAHYALIGST